MIKNVFNCYINLFNCNTHLPKLKNVLNITFNVFKANYVDNMQTMLQSNEIRGHASVFMVNFTTCICLIDI